MRKIQRKTSSIEGRVDGRAQDANMNLKCLQWGCDHFFLHFSDSYASLLESTTENHPAVLTSFTLDISDLSEAGLAYIERVLSRSDLEYICILCVQFKPALYYAVARVLQNVLRYSLKTLVLTGENIDGWLQLWPVAFDLRLQSLHIQGTGPSLNRLSHASVMVIHQLLYESPFVELHFGNIYLQGTSDWGLIIDGIDPMPLEFIHLCPNTANQFLSGAEGMDQFIARFQTQDQGRLNAKMSLDSFTLDVVPLSQDGHVRVQKFLRLTTLKQLCIQCASLHHNLHVPVAHIIRAVPWSTLTSRVLSGEDIDAWIRLSAPAVAPRLEHLIVQSTGSDLQRVSHAGVLILKRLIQGCSLMELKFENVQLHDKRDWLIILRGNHSSNLKLIDFCDITRSQFAAMQVVCALYDAIRDGKAHYACLSESEDSDIEDEDTEAVQVEAPDSETLMLFAESMQTQKRKE